MFSNDFRNPLPWTIVFCMLTGAEAGADTAAPVEPQQTASSDTEGTPSFDLWELQVDGNTVLETALIEKTVYPFLGPGKSIDDVEKARQTLEGIYHDKGYATVLVEIPEQNVEQGQGKVRLQVVEGSIERVKITGSRYYSLGKIRDGLPALAEGQVPHMPAVQEQVGRLATESADRQVTPIFRAGSTPGKMEVELRVKDELPLHGSLEMNGRNTENTSRSRLIASLRYDNLWQRFHSASLSYQVSPENYDDVEVWSGTYVLPTGFFDTRLALYGVSISSNTALGAAVGGLSVVGNGNIYGARLVKPLPAVDQYLHNLTVGLDYKDFTQVQNLQNGSPGAAINQPVTYVPFTVAYDGVWRTDDIISSLSLATHFSIRGLGNDQDQFDDNQPGGDDKRVGSRANFIYFTGELKEQFLLPYDMRLSARALGQISDSPLISNEQFSAGGPQSVRGYHQTQQLGDHGLNLSVELYSPNLALSDWDFAQNFRALAFMDWAYLWNSEVLPGQPKYYQLAAPGAGLRMQIFKHFAGELDWAYPLFAQGQVDVGNQRVDFRLAYEF